MHIPVFKKNLSSFLNSWWRWLTTEIKIKVLFEWNKKTRPYFTKTTSFKLLKLLLQKCANTLITNYLLQLSSTYLVKYRSAITAPLFRLLITPENRTKAISLPIPFQIFALTPAFALIKADIYCDFLYTE